MTFEESVACARVYVRARMPWLWPILAKITPIEDAMVPTAGITEGGVMRLNAAWWGVLPEAEQRGVFAHEAFHLLLQHGPRRGERDPGLWNMAADIVINESLVEQGFAIPAGGCRLPQGITLGTTEEVYDQLLNEQPPDSTPQCGSGAGNAAPGDEEADSADGRASAEVSQASREAKAAASDGKQQGEVPKSLKRELAIDPQRSTVRWQTLLRQHVRRACHWRAGATHYRYDAPSRRQGGLGYGAGKPVLPRLREAIPNVVVAWDTSGSMTQLLPKVAAEVSAILKAVQAKVRVVVCDAQVHGIQDVTSIKAVLGMLKGGGGTDFCPVFEAVTSCDLLVFVTDGEGRAPANKPPYPVIWALVGGTKAPVGWGTALVIT